MDAEQFAQVERTFDALVALPAGVRRATLDGENVDPAIRIEVEALLLAHDRMVTGPGTAAPSTARLAPGTRLGAYRLVEQVGAGGMGEVHRAVRADGAFDREVAVKVLRALHDPAQALPRFVRERQILASLDHPGIVTLLDGGITDDGLAYFVMEHVDGVPLSRHCADRALSLPARPTIRMGAIIWVPI